MSVIWLTLLHDYARSCILECFLLIFCVCVFFYLSCSWSDLVLSFTALPQSHSFLPSEPRNASGSLPVWYKNNLLYVSSLCDDSSRTFSHLCLFVYMSVYVCVFLREDAMLLYSSRLGFLILAPTDLLFRIWCKTGRGLGRRIPISRPQDRRKRLLNCGLSWTWCWSLVYTWSLLINKPI